VHHLDWYVQSHNILPRTFLEAHCAYISKFAVNLNKKFSSCFLSHFHSHSHSQVLGLSFLHFMFVIKWVFGLFLWWVLHCWEWCPSSLLLGVSDQAVGISPTFCSYTPISDMFGHHHQWCSLHEGKKLKSHWNTNMSEVKMKISTTHDILHRGQIPTSCSNTYLYQLKHYGVLWLSWLQVFSSLNAKYHKMI